MLRVALHRLFFVALAGAQTSLGQSLLYERIGDNMDGFATEIHWAGDTNGDGCDDIWVSTPSILTTFPIQGRLTLFSGRNGTVLREWTNANLWATSFTVAGDLDGDGTRDLLVYRPAGRRDEFWILSGATGTQIFAATGAPDSRLGEKFAVLPDIDGDGVDDFAASAAGVYGTSFVGKAVVYSGRTRTVIREHVAAQPGGMYGGGLEAVGDVNGDRTVDLGVGTADGYFNGVLQVFSGRDGSVLLQFSGGAVTPYGFGRIMCGIGDIDGDGRGDLAMGRGTVVEVVRGRDGSLVRTHSFLQTTIASGADYDFDGIWDYLVGEGTSAGRLHVFSGATGNPITVLTGTQPGDQLGRIVRVGGDLNGDGLIDFVTGSYVARNFHGMVRVYGNTAGTFRTFGAGCAGSAGVPAIAAEVLPRVGGQFRLRVDSVRALQPGVLALGASATTWGAMTLPAPLDPAGMPTCMLWVSLDLLYGVSTALGTVRWLGLVPQDRGLIGASLWTQCFLVDPGINPLGVVASNAGEAVIGG